MADTGTATHAAGIEELNGMKRLVVPWTSHVSTGLVEKTIEIPIGGYVSKLETIPSGTAAPSDNYTVTWEDDQGADILQALATANRDTANTEQLAIELSNGLPVPVYTVRTVFKIAAAGNSKQGTAILYWK